MSKVYFQVAVYWPREGGYGAPDTVHTLEDTRAKVDELKRLHFGSKRCPIHIIKCVESEIVTVIDDQPEPEPPTKTKRRKS